MSNNTNYVNWGGTNEQSFPYQNNEAESLVWGTLNSTWSDVQIVGAISRASVQVVKKQKRIEEAKKIIKLISRINGKKIFDSYYQINEDVKIWADDITMRRGPILKKRIIELSLLKTKEK